MTGPTERVSDALYKESVSRAVDFDPFVAPDLLAMAPATESQREIWAAAALSTEASLAYNESVCLALEGSLDVGCMADALTELVARHEALRSSFGPDGQSLCIAREIPLDTTPLDVRTHHESFEAIRHREVITPFDLVNGPLFRCRIIHIDEQRHAVLITAHHTICDGWSFGVLLDELARLYNAMLRGEAALLEPPPPFREHAERQADVDARTRELQEAWWVGQLRDAPAALEFPKDHPRPARRAFPAHYLRHRIPAVTMQRLRARGAKRGCTGYTVLAAAFAAYLHRVTGQDDLILGVPAAGQAEEGLEGLVGHCVSLLPVRSRLDSEEGFDVHLDRFGVSLSDAWEHRDCSMGRIVRALHLPRDPAVVPLVQAILNIDRRIDVPALDGLRARVEGTPRAYENFEMFINAIESKDGLLLECTYDASLYTPETMQRRFCELEHFLEKLCDADTPISSLLLLSDADRLTLAEWGDGAWRDRPATTVDALVREQCTRTPERIAVHSGDERQDYAALGRSADNVRDGLRARGVGRGDIVGVLLERDVNLPAVLLGILETGAAYLPLDPEAPVERLQWMLDDANAAHVITHRVSEETRTAFGGRVVDLVSLLSREWQPHRPEDGQRETALATLNPTARTTSTTRLPNQSATHAPDDPAYVIYTSGSTGKPKGVIVPHRGVANFLQAMRETLEVTADDRFLALTTLSFDIAVLELWLPLTLGARTDIIPRAIAHDGDALCERLAQHPPSVLQATPATWQMLLAAGWQGDENLCAISGGEALPAPLARTLVKSCARVWNLYGPTETTVWSAAHRVSAHDDPVPIGKPIANTQLYVLDASGQPTPPGVPGELYIGGDGVTLGYLNRPELTRERFVADPFTQKDGAMLYRTGDRVRFNANGDVEYLGRVDFQLKLRGYRIEPGEIEAVLESHPAIERSVVVVRDFGTADGPGDDQRLVAYMTLHAGARVAIDDLRAHLRAQLPAYMIPQHFVDLDAMPLTASGKIDRKALPSPTATARAGHVPPQTETEQRIAAIWQEVLGVERISRNDNFFDIGGHSLSSMKAVARIDAVLGCRIRPRLLVLNSLGEIAASCDRQLQEANNADRNTQPRTGWKSVVSTLLGRT